MGQGLQRELISKFLDQSQVVATLNKTTSPWHETSLFTNSQEGPVVIKRLKEIKTDREHADLQTMMRRIYDAIDTEKLHPNVLQYFKESPARVEKTTRFLRQYICYNLSEKIHWLPHLPEKIEKKWLIFQLLSGVQQIHSTNLQHGDIKPENCLVTSYDWLFVADIHPYKPVLIKDDDLNTYNKFFGDLDNNIRCYVAPERWRSPTDLFDRNARLTDEMDVFSTGCVIAEIMMDGLPLFDLARLQQHRRGTFDPKEELQKRIDDQGIVNLILQMIDRDPSKRPNIQKCIADWNEKVFPQSFSQVLFQLGASFQRLSHLYSDQRISLIRYHFNSIYETAVGKFDFATQNLKEPTEPSVYNLLRSCDTVQVFNQLQPQSFQFYHASQSEEHMNQRLKPRTSQDSESLLLVALWLGKLFTSSFYPQSKLVAFEMIQKISQHLPFQVRLNLVLPLVQQAFTTTGADEVAVKCSSTSKIKAKALEVMLGLFQELYDSSSDEITIEPLDYKVASSYIIPIIKRQIESSKNDSLMRLFIAQNLGKLTRLSVMFLEISISSATRRRQEIAESRNEDKGLGHETQFFGRGQMAQFGAHRSTIVGRREDLLETPVVEEELSYIPNYDAQLKDIWEDVEAFIQHISGSSNNDSATMIAMLQSLVDLSQLFGVDKCDFLIQQCISCINNYKDFKVKIQVIKTLAGMSLRIGLKKVDEWVLPLTEQLLEDPEDLVILENIKMINFLVDQKLVNKPKCINLLDQLLPFCLYPNLKIRVAICTFVYLLTPNKQKENQKSSPKPMIEFDDFYCFVRPKLITFVKEYFQMEIMQYLDSPMQIMSKLREPLSLKVMRAYFTMFSKSYDAVMEEQFTSRHCEDLTDNDHFAFAALSSIFREKLKQKMKNNSDEGQATQKIELQGRHADQMYRVIRQAAIQKISTGSTTNNHLNEQCVLNNEQKTRIVQHYAQDETKSFNEQLPAQKDSNYGLNLKTDPSLLVQSIPFEVSQVLRSLNVVPSIPETKTFKNIQAREKYTSRFLRVNSELQMACRGAQAGLIDQFDFLPQSSRVTVKVQDEHKKDLQNVKTAGPPTFKPQGTLVTTLYEHNSAVNTVTVTDDQQFFMTGARAEKEIHIWQVKNIQEDISSKSIHTLNTKSSVNQICMLNNSNTLAAATEQGIELYDLHRVLNEQKFDQEMRQLDLNQEVLQIQSMQSPITYQNLLVAAKQTGGVMLYDLRSRQCAIKDDGVYGSQGGGVSAMCVGKDAFTLTVGTIGGYVSTYDIRYGVVSALYMHHLNWPVLALATYRKNNPRGNYDLASIVSTGGPQHELCQMNMETGQVDVLYRIQQQATGSSQISKSEIPNVPEFFRETKFKDRKFGTLKRDSNLNLFNRSLLNTHSTTFSQFVNQDGMRNIDQYYMELSKQCYKRMMDTYTSRDACRSILLPRDDHQSLMFDNETAGFAITGGNDRKIRYWNLSEPETSSFQVNSPQDDEVLYMKENIQRGVKIVVEKPIGQKDFPKYTTARIKDQLSTYEKNISIKGKIYQVKYPENTSYHNTAAQVLQGKIQAPGGANGQAAKPAPIDWSHVQYQESAKAEMVINSIGGTSQGQHLNNLAITPDPIEDSTEHRIPDVVSHQDAILDMAICQDMLVSCGRDGLIKIWK